jgi:Fe-Mn family superoxide dismutase
MNTDSPSDSPTLTRRQALKTALLGGAALAAGSLPFHALRAVEASPAPKPAEAPAGPFRLPLLPWAADALEPAIDAQTMQIHHGRHHAAYVANLNKAVAPYPELQLKTVEELVRNLEGLPEAARVAVRNHGGGHFNHTLFWQMLSPAKGKLPPEELARAIEKSFGGLSKFFESFDKAAASVFGSGWVWLSLNKQNHLLIETTPNQDYPISHGHVPLLGLDVWEHAYYLKYQNRRADYASAFPGIVNWNFVAERYKTAMG